LKLTKDSPLSNQYKAQLEYHKGNYSEAKNYADLAAQHGSQFLVAKMIAGVSAFQLEDFEQAYNSLSPLEKSLPATHSVKKILAVIKIRLGYTAEAAETLNALEDLAATDSDFLQASSIELMKAGDFETAKNLIEKASKVAPENAMVAAHKGLLLLSHKDLEGIKSLEKAVKLDPSLSDVEMSLAVQYLANGQVTEAKGIAKKWLKLKEKKAAGLLLQGIIAVKQNENTKAKTYFNQVLMIEPDNVAALFNLAILAEANVNFLKAIELHKKIIGLIPGHNGAIKHLSRLQAAQNNTDDTVLFLTSLLEKNPDKISLKLALVQNLRANDELSKAIHILEEMSDDKELPPSYWTILGESYLQAKKVDKAKKSFEHLIHLNKDFYAYLRLISLYELEGSLPKARKTTEDALVEFENNEKLLLLRTNLEILSGDHKAAKTTVDLLKETGSTHYFIYKFQGELALASYNYSQAIFNFKLLYSMRQTALNAMLLARAFKFNDQLPEAAQTLERYLKEQKQDNKLRLLLVELYLKFDDDKAIEHLEILNDIEIDNPVILNNLAWLELKRGKTDKALTYATRSFELSPTSYSILDTYGAVLLSVKKYDTAVSTLEMAIEKGSKSEITYINLGKAYLARGNQQKYRDLLNKIVDNTLYNKIEELGRNGQ